MLRPPSRRSRGRRRADAIGITNQRETTLLWDRADRRPVHRAIVWQDRRTAERCAEPAGRADPRAHRPRPRSVLLGDEARVALRDARPEPDLAFGTVDSWLVWKLTGGRVHATDETNASRTLLCSLETLDWDDELLALFGVRRELLPEIRPSGAHFGEGELLGRTLPIQGIAGDQQAALFAGGRGREGDVRHRRLRPRRDRGAGRGTASCAPPPRGSSTRSRAARSREPSSSTGAAIQWLRDGLHLIEDAAESEALAASLDDNGGVYFVPAFVGLGSPHWRADARGTITGSRAGRPARSSCAPRSRPPRTRRRTCSMRCRRSTSCAPTAA